MKRRYVILAIGFVAFVGIVLGVLAMLPHQSPYGITKRSCVAICNGMTLEEVETIIGMPPGLYDVDVLDINGMVPFAFHTDEHWAGPKGTICVYFDKAGRVVGKRFIEDFPEPPDFWDRTRAWFGR